MRLFTCPVCGGKLNIKIGTEFATCESCGNVTKIDPMDAKRFTEIYRSAERSMRLNSVEGYEEALRQLDSISFIEEARKTYRRTCRGGKPRAPRPSSRTRVLPVFCWQ